MDTKTLMDVVAMIDARIAVFKSTIDKYPINRWEEDEEYYILLAEINVLGDLKWDLQNAIDANVAAMESNTGE
jgi:hypothetical protein